jgi:hypothetical protein
MKYPHLNLEQREKQRKLDHTRLERKRRNQMAFCFKRLKELVPKSNQQEQLHQIKILENAIEYLEELIGSVAYPPSPSNSNQDCYCQSNACSSCMHIQSLIN